MARVVWSPQALADLAAIGDYLAREAPAYAQAFVDGAFDTVARLEYVREAERSKELNALDRPFVVISASGMAEAGRILHHLRNTVADEKNTVLIVGYQADGTLGRRIAERQPEVRIFGEMYPLRAEVEVMSAFSAHADEPGLLGFIGALDRERLRTVFLVHGEPDRQAALTDALQGIGIADVQAPARGQTVRLM